MTVICQYAQIFTRPAAAALETRIGAVSFFRKAGSILRGYYSSNASHEATHFIRFKGTQVVLKRAGVSVALPASQVPLASPACRRLCHDEKSCPSYGNNVQHISGEHVQRPLY